MEEAYEKLKLVLRQEHNLSIVLKMSKEWLGFRPVQFFSYKITGPKIKVTKEKQDAIQAMNFLKNMKTVQLFKDFGSILQDFVPNYSEHASILHYTTHKKFNSDIDT